MLLTCVMLCFQNLRPTELKSAGQEFESGPAYPGNPQSGSTAGSQTDMATTLSQLL